MNNSTENLNLQFYPMTEANIEHMRVYFDLYMVLGISVFLTNLPTVLVLTIYRELRKQKEYMLILGLAVCDAIQGLTLFMAGFMRGKSFDQGTGLLLTSRWDCAMKPWNLIWIWHVPLTALLMLAITVDRLLAVAIPLRYIKLTRRYSINFVLGVYASAILPSIVGFYTSYASDQTPQFPAFCFTDEHALTGQYYMYQALIIVLGSFGSVLLYIPIFILLKSKIQSGGMMQADQLKRMRKVTKTIGICTMFTLVCYISPKLFILFVDGSFPSLLAMFILHSVNCQANVFIYATKLSDIQAGIKSLFRCKKKLLETTSSSN